MVPVALNKEKNLLSLPIHGGALMHQTSYNGSAMLLHNQGPGPRSHYPPENQDRFDQWAHDAFPLFVTIWNRNGGAAA